MKKISKTLWLSAILMFISGICINAQRIEFEKTVHDFGQVSNILGPVTYSFKFKNAGDKPLTIRGVKTTCGCTSPKWSKEPVKPGETGEVSATYLSVASEGTFQRSVTVQTNGSPSTVSLTVKGTITKDINAVFPDSIGKLKIARKNLEISPQTGSVQIVEVANLTDKNINIAIENVPEYLIVTSDSSTLSPKNRTQIAVSVDKTKAKNFGYSTGEFTIKADDVKGKITVSSVVAETIEAQDNAPVVEIENLVIDLGTKSENKLSETLKITNTGASDLIIKTFTTDNPAFVSGLKKGLKINPGKTETVRYSAKNLAKGDNTAQIYLTTNDPKMSLINFTVKIKIE
jgi:hypothetical protein